MPLRIGFNLDDDVTIKNLTSFPITSVGEIAVCGSSKGNFGPTWTFPNGTKVPIQNSSAIQQTKSSPEFKLLRLNYLDSVVLNGNYRCVYTANGAKKTKTVNVISKKFRAKDVLND